MVTNLSRWDDLQILRWRDDSWAVTQTGLDPYWGLADGSDWLHLAGYGAPGCLLPFERPGSEVLGEVLTDPDRMQWQIDRLDRGQTMRLTYRLHARFSLTNGTTLTNTVGISEPYLSEAVVAEAVAVVIRPCRALPCPSA